MVRLAFWVAILVGIGGCGGGGGGTGDDGSGDDTGGPDASDGDRDAPSSGDGGGTDDRLQPLAVGRVWTYDVVSTYPSCPPGQRETRVLSTGTIEGRSVYESMSFCGFEGRTNIEGDRVEEYYDWGPTGWYRFLDEPVADGHTWTTTNGSATFTQTYDSLGSFGGYDDCWKVTQNVQYTSYWILCRGVGLVKSEIIDLAGGTIRAELMDTNF